MADARRAPLKDQTDISGARALIVEARFYDDIQDALLEGAVAELKAAGVSHDVITVPGALEIPAAIAIALDAAESNGKPYDAAIALGCVVRGDTIHFEIVSMESSRALMDLAVAQKISARQRHHHRQHRCAGLGAGARQRTQQGRRRRARGAGDAADQAPAGTGLIMAENKKPRQPRALTTRAPTRRPTGAARRGSPRCRRSTRWTSAAPASTTSSPSSRATGSATRSRATNICRPRPRSSGTSSPAWCATRPSSIPLIDEALSKGWPLKRIDAILRAVLRAGSYELEHRKDVPGRVVVSEYVDVAHAFVEAEETGMVNAVLDQIARQFRADEFSRG